MDKQSFRSLQEKLKILINHTKKQDLERGIDVTLLEYKQALVLLEDKILEKLGLTRQEYENLKAEFNKKEPLSYKKLVDTPDIPVMPTKGEIQELAREVIPQPVITHETRVIKETIKEVKQPQILREIKTIEKIDNSGLDELSKDVRTLQLSLQDTLKEIEVSKQFMAGFDGDVTNKINELVQPEIHRVVRSLQSQIYSTNKRIDGINPVELDPNSLHLDQSTPQTVTASPIFNWGTQNRIPFYSATKTLTDNAGFSFDPTSTKLNVTGEVNTGTLTANTKLSLRAPTTPYYSNFSAPSSQTTTLAYVLPDAFPTGVPKHLTCDLSGNLTWDGVTASKTLLPIADGTYNLGSQDYRFSALYLSSIATDYIPVQGSGAYANLMGARAGFTCKENRLAVVGGNPFSQQYARTKLDILEADQQVVSIDEGNFAQYATATLEGYSTDRARTLLLNRYGFSNQGGSSSHELVWGEYYLSGEEPYIEHHYRSGWTFGNDYGMGLTPDYPDTWLTHSHNMYLWDAVYGYTRELFDHKTYIRRSYNSVDSTVHRQHYESIDDNNLSIGDNALMNAPASGLASIVALGYNAGKNLTNSYGDVIIGTFAQSNSANGGYNVSIGHYAGYQIDGTYNISLGSYSASGTYGYTTQGIYIGAGSAHGLGVGRTIIDNYDRGSTANTIINALIYATASNSGAASQSIRFNAASFTIGGGTNTDITCDFIGTTNSGQYLWMEDEDYFKFNDSILFPDSEPLYFGTGADMSIDYDGTNGNIKTDLVAASDLHIDCGTDKTIVLDESVWEDIQFAIGDGRVGVANFPDWDDFTTDTKEYKFAVDDYIDLGANEMAHWWKEGTAVYPHLHITTDGANTSGSSQWVKFTVYIAYADTNEVWTETSMDIEKEIVNGTADMKHLLATNSSLALTNNLIGTQVKIRVKRIAATSGTEYPNHIFVTQVGFHAELDTMGSRTISSK